VGTWPAPSINSSQTRERARTLQERWSGGKERERSHPLFVCLHLSCESVVCTSLAYRGQRCTSVVGAPSFQLPLIIGVSSLRCPPSPLWVGWLDDLCVLLRLSLFCFVVPSSHPLWAASVRLMLVRRGSECVSVSVCGSVVQLLSGGWLLLRSSEYEDVLGSVGSLALDLCFEVLICVWMLRASPPSPPFDGRRSMDGVEVR